MSDIANVWHRLGNNKDENKAQAEKPQTEKQKLSAAEATAQVLLADDMVGPRERMLARLQARYQK